MKTVPVPPGAKRLIEDLKDIGYDFHTAVADLVDNSIISDASDVFIDVNAKAQPFPYAHVIIADNGLGMNRDDLREAMRFGTERIYAQDELGKYGLGMKTASLSQCNKLTVASRPEGRGETRAKRTIFRWDMDYINKHNKWEVVEPEWDELSEWEKKALDHPIAKDRGTVVLWSHLADALPLLEDEDNNRRLHNQAQLLEAMCLHLRMVFHRFIQGRASGRKRLKIYVGSDEPLKPWDPFCLDVEKTRELDTLRCPVSVGVSGRKNIVIRPYILPNKEEFSSPSAHAEASGPLNWNQQQGFYFYRNDRLLQSGGWSNMRAADEHTKLLRIAVDFPSDLDKAFSININKMRAKIPDAIREELRAELPKWVGKAEKRYRKGGGRLPRPKPGPAPNPAAITFGNVTFTMSNTPSGEVVVAPGGKDGHLKIVIPQRNDLSAMFGISGSGPGELRRLCLGLLAVLESVRENKLKPSDISIDQFKRAIRRLL